MPSATPAAPHAVEPSREYSREEVLRHTTPNSLWVVHRGAVYDLSEFAHDHPGGADLLLAHAGEDVTETMRDKNQHVHSKAAFDMLASYRIGSLAPSSSSVRVGKVCGDEPTDDGKVVRDPCTNQVFIDLSKPLFYQMWTTKVSREVYLRNIHRPHHLRESARFFKNDWLEPLSRTSWWTIPITWFPIIAYLSSLALESVPIRLAVPLFIIGMVVWTLTEYSLHRFLFHLDERLLPDHRYALALHFTIHGIHHFLPMDKLRLVFPPVLGFSLAVPLYQLVKALVELPTARAIFSGALFGYVCYDLTHYYLHHSRPVGTHFREMKTYHLAHHYKDPDNGFGITQKWWDKVFGTELVL